jgi:hypothetical protein
MGAETGSETEDNARTLDNSAATVAGFRCATPPRADTWMKDALEDSGAEPDPALADAPMWKSPSIWVRHEKAPPDAWQHAHQNPIIDVVNYVYVELNHGVEAATGRLELYVADASTNLEWDADWVPLTSQDVEPALAGRTHSVEFEWTPKHAGHYCLLARWSSDTDPMTGPEGPEIEPNVRGNNNLVWRNVNVLDLEGEEGAIGRFSIVNHRNKAARYSLALRPANALRDAGFLGRGAIGLRLGDRLVAALAVDRIRSSGFERRGDLLVLTDPRGGVLEGILLPAGVRIQMEVVASRRPGGRPWRHPFTFDVVQFEAAGSGAGVIGGVSYELIASSRDR